MRESPLVVVDPWLLAEGETWAGLVNQGRATVESCSKPRCLCLGWQQSRRVTCVLAATQVKDVSFAVYVVPCFTSRGWRFREIVMSGLRQHPAVFFVEKPEAANLSLWLPTCAPQFRALNSLGSNVAVLEESDLPGSWPAATRRKEPVFYFKRSWADVSNGSHSTLHHQRSPKNADRGALTFLPLAYGLWDNYTQGLLLGRPRTYDVVCTVRGHAEIQPSRTRVVQWLEEFKSSNLQRRVLVGDTGGHRRKVDTTYFDLMQKARIVVTANPSAWTGDFRTYEALATGALVFVDELHTPAPFALKDAEHLIVYDTHDKVGFFKKLTFYIEHPAEASRIAANGLHFVLTHHRSLSRIDYILRSVHDLLLRRDNETVVPYTETALEIRDSKDHETHQALLSRSSRPPLDATFFIT